MSDSDELPLLPEYPENISGQCPFDGCQHSFVGADGEQLARHARGHGITNMPDHLAALVIVRQMDFRREQHR